MKQLKDFDACPECKIGTLRKHEEFLIIGNKKIIHYRCTTCKVTIEVKPSVVGYEYIPYSGGHWKRRTG